MIFNRRLARINAGSREAGGVSAPKRRAWERLLTLAGAVTAKGVPEPVLGPGGVVVSDFARAGAAARRQSACGRIVLVSD